jgi:hypothetical protein
LMKQTKEVSSDSLLEHRQQNRTLAYRKRTQNVFRLLIENKNKKKNAFLFLFEVWGLVKKDAVYNPSANASSWIYFLPVTEGRNTSFVPSSFLFSSSSFMNASLKLQPFKMGAVSRWKRNLLFRKEIKLYKYSKTALLNIPTLPKTTIPGITYMRTVSVSVLAVSILWH